MRYVLLLVGALLSVLGIMIQVAGERSHAERAARAAHLDAECGAAMQRIGDKRRVADALLGRDLTIQEAADRMARILGGEPTVLACLRDEIPGASDEELALRQVATFVRTADRPEPGRADQVLRELDAAMSALSADPGWVATSSEAETAAPGRGPG